MAGEHEDEREANSVRLGWCRLAMVDLDGTLYRGNQVIPGAPEFILRLLENGIVPVYFTNNSTRTPEEVARVLRTMGIPAKEHNVCTSSQAAAEILLNQVGPGARVSYVGMEGLRLALEESKLIPVPAGLSKESQGAADAAVMGLKTDVTFQELADFCQDVARLGRFVLTNGDLKLPTETGFWPGNGSFGRLVEAATGVHPKEAGKPEVSFVEYVLHKFGVEREGAVLIGDNARTDIAAGRNAGVYTIQVMSGVPAGQTTEGESFADETYASVADIDL